MILKNRRKKNHICPTWVMQSPCPLLALGLEQEVHVVVVVLLLLLLVVVVVVLLLMMSLSLLRLVCFLYDKGGCGEGGREEKGMGVGGGE